LDGVPTSGKVEKFAGARERLATRLQWEKALWARCRGSEFDSGVAIERRDPLARQLRGAVADALAAKAVPACTSDQATDFVEFAKWR
jgi:hypothetical protein